MSRPLPEAPRRRPPLFSGLYALLCCASLLYVFFSGYQWFGLDGDPMSALPAMLLGLPWSLVLGLLPEVSPAFGLLLLVLCMGLNLGIAIAIRRRHARRLEQHSVKGRSTAG